MNRQIKFRAKTDANGHWVYGSLIDYGDGTFAICNSKSQPWVQADTIGQYTGLTDKNGTEIYEGDILKWTVRNRSKNRKGTHKPYKNPHKRFGKVVWSLSGLRLKNVDYPDAKWNYVLLNPSMDLEVIGNIHDKKDEE